MTRLILEGRNHSYEELPSDVQNLNFSILEDKLIRETGIDSCDTNILKTLNLYSDETGYNIAAAILADENIYPGIDIGRFGESISIIKTRKTFQHCSALALYDSACEMFNDYYEYDVIEGTTRKTVKSIPEEAFRETIANALKFIGYGTSKNIYGYSCLMIESKCFHRVVFLRVYQRKLICPETIQT